MPDKHEVDGSIPFEPTTLYSKFDKIVQIRVERNAH